MTTTDTRTLEQRLRNLCRDADDYTAADPTSTEGGAEFIAHARADIPALLDRIVELEDQEAAAWSDLAAVVVTADERGAERDQLRELVAAMRAAMDAVRPVVEAVAGWRELAGDDLDWASEQQEDVDA